MAYYNPTFAQNTGGFNTNFSQNFGQTVQTPQVPNVVYVNGEEGAKNYPVAAGNTVLLLDFNTNQFWLKSTASNGVFTPMRSFSFVENTPKVESAPTDYVTKKELNDLKTYLEDQFSGIRNQLYWNGQKRGNVNDKSNAK